MTSSTPDGSPADLPGKVSETSRQSSDVSAAPRLSLTQFLDLDTLQEIQDSFTAVTGLSTTIRNRDGSQITTDTDPEKQRASHLVLEQLIATDSDEKGRFSAPIMVEGQVLGSIIMEPKSVDARPTGHEVIKQDRACTGRAGRQDR